MRAKKASKLSPVTQNVVLGTITGVVVGYDLRIIFQHVGGIDLVWILFFFVGPLVGYLSGRERQRIEELKREKMTLKENLDRIQTALKRSANKYKLLVECANDAIFLTSGEGRFLLFNEATCLFSGYRKEELKQMNLSQLRVEESPDEQSRKAWLASGIYQYEEKWRAKDGSIVVLEINAKWIRLAGHRLVLHVGRDMLHRKETDGEETARAIQRFHQKKLTEMASVHRIFYSHILSPLSDVIGLSYYLLKKYPEEAEKLSDALSEWRKTRNFLQGLSEKNARDVASSPRRWSLNEILNQELYYLEAVTDFKGVTKKMSFAPELPMVFGVGRDFSLAFGTVFGAALASMGDSKQRELSALTRSMGDHILVEIRMNPAESFEEHLCSVIDPFFRKEEFGKKRTETGLLICQTFFAAFRAKMDVGRAGGEEVLVRIRVPATQESEPVRKETPVEISEEDLLII